MNYCVNRTQAFCFRLVLRSGWETMHSFDKEAALFMCSDWMSDVFLMFENVILSVKSQ